MSDPAYPSVPQPPHNETQQAELPVLVEQSFRIALVQERDAVRKSYLEITELRHRLVAAETRATRVRNSLSFRLGHVIAVTHSAKDFVTLVPRLYSAYRDCKRQKKKAHVAVTVPSAMARRAAALRQALDLARSRGYLAAAQWARGAVRDRHDLARILVEIGFLAFDDGDGAAATDMAARAHRLAPDSPRLRGLAFTLEAGASQANVPPAGIRLAG